MLLTFLLTALMCMGGCSYHLNTDTASPDKIITFAWWGNDDRHTYTMKAMDIFMEQNPDIQVKYKYGVWNGYDLKNRVWMRSHNEPDVMQINYSWLREYSPDGRGYYDLNKISGYIDLKNFTSDDLAFGTVNGSLNAIPIAYNTPTMYYNKDLFDKYKLDLPKTWDDFFRDAKVMSRDGIYPLGLVRKQLFLALISHYEQETGSSVFNTNGTLALNESGMEDILEFYKRLCDEKVLMPVDDFDRVDFIGGKAAGTMSWVSDAGAYCDELISRGTDAEIGEYPMTDNPKASGWYRKPATMYAVASNTSEPEAAGRLLNFLLNSSDMAKLQGTEKGVPVSAAARKYLKDTGDMDSMQAKADEKMRDHSSEMKVMIPSMENEDIINAFKVEADKYLYGREDLSTCASAIVSQINSIIAGTSDSDS